MRGLDFLIGLATEKERARIDILASHRLGETFPHTLLHGIGGTGKTAFCRAIAEELNYFFHEKEAASLRSREDIIDLLVDANSRAGRAGLSLLLFVDEIHRLTNRQQEVFYYPMTERRLDRGDDSWLSLSPFTLVGATTQIDKLDEHCFVKRFQNVWHIKPYNECHIIQILSNLFKGWNIVCEYSILQKLASHCQGLPRTAVREARNVRNFVVACGRRVVTNVDILRVLTMNRALR